MPLSVACRGDGREPGQGSGACVVKPRDGEENEMQPQPPANVARGSGVGGVHRDAQTAGPCAATGADGDPSACSHLTPRLHRKIRTHTPAPLVINKRRRRAALLALTAQLQRPSALRSRLSCAMAAVDSSSLRPTDSCAHSCNCPDKRRRARCSGGCRLPLSAIAAYSLCSPEQANSASAQEVPSPSMRVELVSFSSSSSSARDSKQRCGRGAGWGRGKVHITRYETWTWTWTCA